MKSDQSEHRINACERMTVDSRDGAFYQKPSSAGSRDVRFAWSAAADETDERGD